MSRCTLEKTREKGRRDGIFDVCAFTRSKFREVLINRWFLPYFIAAMLVDGKQYISR